jgi:hypothetical protein
MQSCDNGLGDRYTLKPFHRKVDPDEAKLANLFSAPTATAASGANDAESENLDADVETHNSMPTAEVQQDQELPEWEFD